MSRLGKRPVVLPQGVSCVMDGQKLLFKGPKGQSSVDVPPVVACDVGAESVSFTLEDGLQDKKRFAHWGRVRSLSQSAVQGVSNGFSVDMKMEGVGYKVALQGSTLQLQLGFSHDVNFPIPDDIKVSVSSPTTFQISGVSAQRVGQVVSNIQEYRPPEPYKGKGVHRVGQYVRRKEGKKK